MAKTLSCKTYTAIPEDAILNCNCTSAALTLNLYDATNCAGKTIVVKKVDSGANAVTVLPVRRQVMADGVLQVETATVAGTVSTSGNAAVVVTAAGLPAGAVTYSVAVLENDTAAIVAGKIYAALIADANLTNLYDVAVSGAVITLTQIEYTGNDSTLNISVDNDTSAGITQATTSTSTTAGVAVTVATQNEYKKLECTGSGWQVIDSGGASATETLVNKTLTAPAMTSPDITFGVAAKDYAGAHADWTLSAANAKALILSATNADGAVNAIAPATAGKVFIVYNGTGQTLTIKVTGQSGVAIANTKTAIVRCNGTDYVRVTADA